MERDASHVIKIISLRVKIALVKSFGIIQVFELATAEVAGGNPIFEVSMLEL
jgi:hypothetical protein